MNRLWPLVRLAGFMALSVWLGSVLMQIPQPLTLSLPDKGVAVTVPETLEGWVLKPGDGDILVEGQTHLGLVTLEIAAVPVSTEGAVYDEIARRHAQVKQGKTEYVVWHQGPDSKFGRRQAPTYKATYQGTIFGPLTGEIWQYDTYWPYRGQYARISMRYPNFLVNQLEPDKAYIGSRIKLDQ